MKILFLLPALIIYLWLALKTFQGRKHPWSVLDYPEIYFPRTFFWIITMIIVTGMAIYAIFPSY